MDLVHNTFDAGELAPVMDGRLDLPQYYRGCRLLENFIVLPTGGVMRRPGFYYKALVKTSADATRVIGFVNKTDKYVLEFGDYYMRVFKDGAPVLSGASPYELVTPWSEDEVFDLVFAPRGQAIFHPDHDIYELVCNSDASWTLTAFGAEYGPFMDENKDEDITITPSGTTGSIILTASEDLFYSGHVGALWQITHRVDEASLTGQFDQTSAPPFTTGETSGVLTVKGRWNLAVEWRGWGKLKLQRSDDGGDTWLDLKTWDKGFYVDQMSIQDAGEELEDGVTYRFSIDWTSPSDPDLAWDLSVSPWTAFTYVLPYCHYSLKVRNTWQTGIVRITGVTTPTTAAATVLLELGDVTATYKWAEASWSDYRGYPACGTIHESRIWAARTTYQPTALWAGRTFMKREDARLFYGGTSVEADDAFTRTIDQRDCNVIEWLASLWVMLVGSDGNVMKGIGASEYQPITPTDANFMPQAGMGSASVQPQFLNGFIVYVGRAGKRVYEMTYSDDARVYEPEDLTRFAEHIASTGIVDWAFMQQPYPILWAVTADGYLIGLTRNRKEELMGWHRHVTGDSDARTGWFESVAVIPGTVQDELWVVTKRLIDGVYYRFIERMAPFDWGTDQRDCFFVDCGITYDGGAAVNVADIEVAAGTNRVTVTAANHGFSNGDRVWFANVGGMTELNAETTGKRNHVYTVADATTHRFVLKTRDASRYIDGSAFGTYTSGGTVEKVYNTITASHLGGSTVKVLGDGQIVGT